ncbi:MAG: hypothetical protein H0X51_05375 [Parachlamydiaceae bacterium]|nr:hypothetical protein [Parachlamydiaceae bacterium]
MIPAGVLDSIWIGESSLMFKRQEQDGLKGVNRFLTVISQTIQISNVRAILDLMKQQLSTAGVLTERYRMPSVLYLAPLLITVLSAKYSGTTYPRLKVALNFINTHVGTVCHMAIAVSAVWLIFCGQPVGYISLAYMILGFAQRRFWLPMSVTTPVQYFGLVGVNVSRILSGHPVYLLLAFMDIKVVVSDCIHKLRPAPANNSQRERPPRERPAPAYNILELPEYSEMRLRVNKEHLKFQPAPPIPGKANVDLLQAEFDAFSLKDENLKRILLRKVGNDDHWREFHSHENEPQQKMEYIQEGLRKFIRSTGHGKIDIEGQIYKDLNIRAKAITEAIIKLPSDKHKFEKLVEVALTGHYCPAAFIDETTILYNMNCYAYEHDSVEYRFNDLLAKYREGCFNNMLSTPAKDGILEILQAVYGVRDRHLRNVLRGTLGDVFGVAEVEELSPLQFRQLMHQGFEDEISDFNSSYKVKNILELVKELPRTPYFFNKVKSWFIEEIKAALEKTEAQRDLETPAKYQVRLTELATQHYERADKEGRTIVMDDETGYLKDNYLAYLLIETGVLELGVEVDESESDDEEDLGENDESDVLKDTSSSNHLIVGLAPLVD